MSDWVDYFEGEDPQGPESSFEHKGIKLVLTCGACPEQYDAFDGRGRKAGYLRLRHGHFYAAYPNCGGEVVYQADTIGDGIFALEEREKHLKAACKALKARKKREL